MAEMKEGKKKYTYKTRSFTVGFDERGKRIRIKVRGKTQAEVNKKYKQLKEQYEQGLDPRWEDITVAEWASMWLRTYKKPNVGEKQYVTLSSIVTKHIIVPIGGMLVKDVREVHLQKILNALKGKSKSLTDKVVDCLEGIFGTAKTNGLTIINPTETLDVPKNKDNKREPLTPYEREIVLRTAYRHQHGLMLLIMLYCGLRRAEVLPLTWGDIDLESGFITIEKGVSMPVNQAILKDETKTDAGMRKVFIVPALREKLEEARAAAIQDIAEKLPDIVPNEKEYISNMLAGTLLFPMKDGRIRSNTSFRRLWESFQREMEKIRVELIKNCSDKNAQKEWENVDVEKIIAHRLRHTFATDLQEAEVQERTLKYLIGHKQTDITSRYAKVLNNSLARAYKRYVEYLKWDKNGTNGSLSNQQSLINKGIG